MRNVDFSRKLLALGFTGVVLALAGASCPKPCPEGTTCDPVQNLVICPPGSEKGVPCEYLRLNMAIAPTPVGQRNRMGVLAGQLDGYPNGRRLEDDVVDISLQVSAGVLIQGFNMAPNNQLGDTVTLNDEAFLTTFPYVSPPHDGVDRGHNP